MPRTLTASVLAAIAEQVKWPVWFAELEFTSGFVRYWTGLAPITADLTDHSAAVWQALRSAQTDVGLYCRRDHSRDLYELLQRLDTYRWSMREFYESAWLATGDTNVHCLSLHYIAKPMLAKPRSDGSVVETGTWNAGGSNAAAYDNAYHASITTGDYVEFTAPSGTVALGLRTVCATNGGLAKVTIGGDATAANLCFTAQQMVDSGEYPNTILVANGGTLNPTDRVIDFDARSGRTTIYAEDLEYDCFIPIADNLSAAAHVLRLTVTGYKYSFASDVKVYSSGYLYRSATTLMSDTNAVPMRVESVFGVPFYKSSEEYALIFNPAGGTYNSFIGNRAHGYDQETALSFTLDGAALTPTQGAVSLGSSLVATRTSEIRHPEIGAGATNVADSTVIYRLSQDGLTIDRRLDWNEDVTVGTSYVGMMSVSRDVLGKVSGGNLTTDVSLTGSDANPGSTSGGTDTMWAWDSGGNIAAGIRLSDPASSVLNFALPPTHKAFWVDYSAAVYGKAYFSRSRSSGTEAVTTGDVHTARFTLRVNYLTDADASLARVAATTVWTPVGNLGGISPLRNTDDLRADNITLSLSGIDSGQLALALGSVRQGKSCKVWIAFLNESYVLIADPVLIFSGLMDVPTIDEGAETSTITISAENRLARLRKQCPRRYTDEDQQIDYPGDEGFEYVLALAAGENRLGGIQTNTSQPGAKPPRTR